MSLQISQHHWLRRLSFLHCMFFLPSSTVSGLQTHGHISDFLFWSVASCVFGSSVCVLCFEVTRCALSSLCTFSQDGFDFRQVGEHVFYSSVKFKKCIKKFHTYLQCILIIYLPLSPSALQLPSSDYPSHLTFFFF